MVDRPDVEAPQGVELTGTNSRTATHTPPHKGWQDKRSYYSDDGETPRASHHESFSTHASTIRSPTHHTTPRTRGVRDDNHRFAAAMAQGRRPDPFRTRKRRPGTAMVLHPTGCGRVARRRTNTPRRGRDATHAPPPPSIPKTHTNPRHLRRSFVRNVPVNARNTAISQCSCTVKKQATENNR